MVMNEHETLRGVFVRKELEYTLELPQSAPHSLISKEFSMDKKDAVHSSTRKLYLKYIDHRASLEVNINSKTRSQLDRIFNQMEDAPLETNTNESTCEVIMPWLEAAAQEIACLMLDSYYRFRQTEIFLELIEQEANSTPKSFSM